MKFDKKTQLSIAYAILTLLLLLSLQNYFSTQVENVPYSQFRHWVQDGQVPRCTFIGEFIQGRVLIGGVDGNFRTVAINDPELLSLLEENQVEYTRESDNNWFTQLLSWILPAVFFVGIWMFMARRMGGGSGGLMSIGKSKAKVYMEKGTGITFDDVAGIDEAKDELLEIVEFLRTPERFQALGGRIPRGVLLVGSPGTGKTLLAKAVAGEASVPFFFISGSDFVEMFVGVGAARVRDLFEQAKKHAPAIIFIDELDALGKARGAGSFGGHDEREQTLNQLLTELDGFETNAGVILMGATNRPEILDPALLRPGRFDRTVAVDRPDVKGRDAILHIHAKQVKLAPEVDLHKLAVRTPGFAGADLANIVNEAALLAARRDRTSISMAELEEAIERSVAGLERKSRVLNKKERRIVAYHEAGHAMVGEILPEANPVQKISIVSRGIAALGYTLNMPLEDRYLMTQDELQDTMAAILGGRAAEEVVFNEISTGAANDLQQATEMAGRMVKEFGMSKKVGMVAHREERSQQFLGMGGGDRPYSDDTARLIDEEVKGIIGTGYERAKELLAEHREALESIVEILFEKEVMDGDELRKILTDHGVELPPRLKGESEDSVEKAVDTTNLKSTASAPAEAHGELGSSTNGNTPPPPSEPEGPSLGESPRPEDRDAS
jgi:cell division protease FtsH